MLDLRFVLSHREAPIPTGTPSGARRPETTARRLRPSGTAVRRLLIALVLSILVGSPIYAAGPIRESAERWIAGAMPAQDININLDGALCLQARSTGEDLANAQVGRWTWFVNGMLAPVAAPISATRTDHQVPPDIILDRLASSLAAALAAQEDQAAGFRSAARTATAVMAAAAQDVYCVNNGFNNKSKQKKSRWAWLGTLGTAAITAAVTTWVKQAVD